MTQRLNQIEAILERTAQRAEANTGAMSDDNPLLYETLCECVYAQLRSTVNSLLQVRNFEAIVTELREIRSEIRGLKTESQHILEHLFGRQENGK
ncbi:hypothetical protein [Nostoc sp.]|uniref:hypothetical protein n=1 Tax=Nostoc sp. TaxID=1180 RepID=UPI002FFC1423